MSCKCSNPINVFNGVCGGCLEPLEGAIHSENGTLIKAPNHNAYLSTGDSCEIVLYDSTETVDMFGQDMLDEYGCAIPQWLIERYQANINEFRRLQAELRKYRK